MTEKKKGKKSFWNKLKDKISKIIPDPIKRHGKRLGIIFSFVTFGTIGANATAPSSAPLAETIGKNIAANANIRPTEIELKTICSNYANNVNIQKYYQEYIDSIMAETGASVLKSDSAIQAQMRTQNGRTVLINTMGNEALGGNFGKTSKTPAWHLHCGWAGMRGLYLGMKKAGTEEFFNNSLEILSQANMNAANFGYYTFAKTGLLHVSKTQKKLGLNGVGIKENKKALLEEIKNHPNDIILLGIHNHHRGGSGHHFVKIAGGKLISYNREKIADPEEYISKTRDIGWWINMSEYERQNQDNSHISAELAEQIYKAAQEHLKNKTYPIYFNSQINNSNLSDETKETLKVMTASLVMNGSIENKAGNIIINNLMNKLDAQAVTHLGNMLSSNKISAERKVEITTMFQDLVNMPTSMEVKANSLTEEQILKAWTKESAETMQASAQMIQNDKTMELDEKQLYITTLAQLWQPIKTAQIQIQKEQISAESMKNIQVTKNKIVKKQTSYRKAKKAAKMAMKRARKSTNKTLADVRAAKQTNLHQNNIRSNVRTLGG